MKRTVMLIVSALALGICTLRAEQEVPEDAIIKDPKLEARRKWFNERLGFAFPDRKPFPKDFSKKTNLVTRAEAYGPHPDLTDSYILTTMRKNYSQDIDTFAGRVRWHGMPNSYLLLTNRQCHVEFYKDGFVYVVPTPPKKPRFAYTNRVYRVQFNRAKNTSERLLVINDWAEEMTAEQLKAELEQVRDMRTVAECLLEEIDSPRSEYSQRWEDQHKRKVSQERDRSRQQGLRRRPKRNFR